MGKDAPDITQYLRAGERVLWQARPIAPPPRKRLPSFDIVLGMAVLAGVYVALGEFPIFRLPITALIAILALGLLLALIAAPMANRRFMRQTAYALTSERAIVLSGKQVFSQLLNENTRTRLSGTTPDTMEIWNTLDQARAEIPPMRFQQLADGGPAYAVLEQLLNGKFHAE